MLGDRKLKMRRAQPAADARSDLLRTAALLVAAVVGAADLPAQTPEGATFSGTWKADVAHSDFGSLGEPKAFVRTVEYDDLRLAIAVNFVDDRGQAQTGGILLTLDGQESVSTVGTSEVRARARRLGSRLLLETSRNVEGLAISIHELWSLSADGKTLTIEGVVSTSMGEDDLLVVMNRQ